MPKRVWILGAGASKDMGYPLGLEVITEIDRLVSEKLKDTDDIYIRWKDALEAIRIIFGDEKLDNIDIEDYMSRLRLLAGGYIKAFGDKSAGHINKLANDLMIVYAWFLNMMRLESHAKWDKKRVEVFKQFCSKLQPSTDVLVSFNQDQLVEGFLKGTSQLVDRPVVNTQYKRRPDAQDALAILKLHGAYNWYVLSQDDAARSGCGFVCRIFDGNSQSGDMTVYESPKGVCLNGPEGPLLPIMMPPDILKGVLTSPDKYFEIIDIVFKGLYEVAQECLKEALQVIIVGFSARPTDYLASMLLNLGLRGKTADQVLVIDPSEKVPEGISRNIKKFTYIRKGFHRWIEEGGLEALDKTASPSP